MGSAAAADVPAAAKMAKNRKKQQLSSLGVKKSASKSQNKDKPKKKNKKFNIDKLRSSKHKNEIEITGAGPGKKQDDVVQWPTASHQLKYFVHQYQSANGVQLSSLEMDSLKETSLVEMCPGPVGTSTTILVEHMKVAFESWKEVLCQNHIQKGQVDPGNPALLVISSSALRSLELLRELRSFTKECHAAKLFSKHMKIEEQVSLLKNRVNIASGTPSRIKKLIDMEALGLTRLAVIVLDMHPDVKGYSLFNLPQVSDEFWDLYKSHFHQPLLQGSLRICLYGPPPVNYESKKGRRA